MLSCPLGYVNRKGIFSLSRILWREANAHLFGAIESNSSKKSTHGLATAARSNRSRTYSKQIRRCQPFSPLQSYRFLGRPDVLVQKFGPLDADEVKSTLLRHCGCKHSFPAARISIQQKSNAAESQQRYSPTGREDHPTSAKKRDETVPGSQSDRTFCENGTVFGWPLQRLPQNVSCFM